MMHRVRKPPPFYMLLDPKDYTQLLHDGSDTACVYTNRKDAAKAHRAALRQGIISRVVRYTPAEVCK